MERLVTEQFLPCSEAVLFRNSERLPFEEPQHEYGLVSNIKATPMHSGFKVSFANKSLYIKDIHLLERLSESLLAPHDQQNEHKHELEEMHAVGMLVRNGKGKLLVASETNEFSHLYDGVETTWFCMSPEKIEIDLSSFCNIDCVHCSREAGFQRKSENELSEGELFKIVQEAANIGVESITLMGGEPTLHPYFFELAYFAKIKGIKYVSTSTNGTTINKETASLYPKLFSSIQVSLHGADATTHDAVTRSQGSFEKATQAIRLLAEAGMKRLNVSFTVMGCNKTQHKEMITISKNLGASSLRFLALASEGRGSEMPQLTEEDKAEVATVLADKSCVTSEDNFPVEGGGFPRYVDVNRSATFYGCPAGRTLMYIAADGEAGLCPSMKIKLGNVRSSNLLELWHSPQARRFRKRISCNCPYTEFCSGGCLGNPLWKKKYLE